jgi:Na+-translocating membrane potential-generating system (MpsC)
MLHPACDHAPDNMFGRDSLMPNEEFLLANGQVGTVEHLRRQYQKAIAPTFRAAVERVTGRAVRGFSSHVELADDPFMVEIFRLEPR